MNLVKLSILLVLFFCQGMASAQTSPQTMNNMLSKFMEEGSIDLAITYIETEIIKIDPAEVGRDRVSYILNVIRFSVFQKSAVTFSIS